MAGKNSEDWRGPLAGDVRLNSVATLEKIGAQLQIKLAHIVAEPLPPRLDDLLQKLAESVGGK